MKRIFFAALFVFATGCSQQMGNEPYYRPLEPSDFFGDGQSARPLVEGTVARGHLRTDRLFFTGKNGKDLSNVFPFPVTREVVERGRQRFQIFCTPSHGALGTGDGVVVQRGFRTPPSYHIDRLRQAPVGHFYDVQTNGFGAMASYASRIPPRDRWAIASYIRALQLSQNARIEDVPADERAKLLSENK
jgi:hypothetical protein